MFVPAGFAGDEVNLHLLGGTCFSTSVTFWSATPITSIWDGPKHVRPNKASPSQLVQFALIGPIIRVSYIAVTHRIIPHVFPFLAVAFAAPQLAIPMVTLPNLTLFADQTCRARFPKTHPTFKRRGIDAIRCTEKVHMIRHDNVAPNEPRRCFRPRIQDRLMRRW